MVACFSKKVSSSARLLSDGHIFVTGASFQGLTHGVHLYIAIHEAVCWRHLHGRHGSGALWLSHEERVV